MLGQDMISYAFLEAQSVQSVSHCAVRSVYEIEILEMTVDSVTCLPTGFYENGPINKIVCFPTRKVCVSSFFITQLFFFSGPKDIHVLQGELAVGSQLPE